MFKLLLIAFVAVAIAQDDLLDQDFELNFDLSGAEVNFETWSAFSGLDLEFATPEVLQEYENNFQINAELIKNFNSEPDHSFTLGFNKYTHLSPEQFAKTRFGFEMEPEFRSLPAAPAAPAFNSYTKANVPASRDYKSKMQPVLDQASCGSCWAFATVGMLEGVQKMKTIFGLYWSKLSPQYLVDCDTTNPLKCSGGNPLRAMRWLQNTSQWKIPTLTSYPYTASNSSTCKSTYKITLSTKNPQQIILNGDEEQLKVLVANYGPVITAMFGNVLSPARYYQNYQSGIFEDPSCPTTNQCATLNHVVVIVGYGTYNGVPYWLARNSYGTSWGEQGYFRIIRGKNNCGIGCIAYVVD